MGLLDHRSRGRVILAGVDTSHSDELQLTALRARKLGFVFQFHDLLPAFTALENVMLPTWADEGYPTRALRERAAAIRDAVGLSERKHYKTSDCRA